MERDGGGFVARAAELLRMLAAATAAVRLYPPTSPLRVQAIERFVTGAGLLTSAYGPVQYRIDRTRFIVQEAAVGEAQPQVSALAETLHALQIAQLIVAPGLATDETARFLDVLGHDAKAVRASGGVRSALLEAGVQNIAVVEVTLRSSAEEGLAGLDLTQAPLEEIAAQLGPAVDAWADSAQAGDGGDAVADAIGRLEPAARDLATQRCAEALLHLDEATRVRVLRQALATDASGKKMSGMLDVVARMSPSALARLLRLAADAAGQPPNALLGAIDLPVGLAAELTTLLGESPVSERDSGVPERTDAGEIARDAVADEEAELDRIRALVTAATPRERARRALGTTVRIASAKTDEAAVRAVIDALGPAVSTGAYDEVALAAELLARAAADPALESLVQESRGVLGSPELLRECVNRLAEDPQAPGPRALIERAGTAGIDALVLGYAGADPARRAALLPLARLLVEPVALSAGKLVRGADRAAAIGALDLLRALASRRLLPTMANGLEHPDAAVRDEALAAIAEVPGPEAYQVLAEALGHRDHEVRIAVVRAIGRARRVDALGELLRIAESSAPRDRNLELKRETFNSIEALGSRQAVPILTKMARRAGGIGKRRRELRALARATLAALERASDGQ